MLTQDFDIKHWDWDGQDTLAIQNQDEYEMGLIIKRKLEDKGIKVKALYAVKHSQDTKMAWDETVQQQVVVYKTNHGHWVAVLETPVFLSEIASAVGLEEQYLEKPKAGRYSCDNMIAYLTHIKYVNKYQYSPADVKTIVGENYMNIYTERKEAWEKARAKIKVQEAKKDIDWLESMILTGEIKKPQVLLTDEYFAIYAMNKRKARAKIKVQEAKKDIDWLESMILTGEIKKPQVLLTDEYFAIYAMNKRRCEDAFDTYAERKIYKTIQLMEQGAFKVSVFFITGRPGAGKSFFTDQLAKSLQEQAKEHGEDWEICSVAASNPFDEYRGEEILVMDDLRGMSLTASDWLKLLDPDRVNTGTARYRNKRMACRTIIINSEKDLCEFFFYMKGMGSAGSQEAMDQFFRRIMARVVVYCYEDGSRRVLIGNRTKTEPYSVQVADTKMAVTNTFSEDAFDMNYDDALYEDGSRRVLIGNRTKTEPYSVQVADTKMAVTNTFSEDAFDMNYDDALKSLTLCVAYNNNWVELSEKEKFDNEASIRGAVEKACYLVAKNEPIELEKKYNDWVSKVQDWAFEDIQKPPFTTEKLETTFGVYDFDTWLKYYKENDVEKLNTVYFTNGITVFHGDEE